MNTTAQHTILVIDDNLANLKLLHELLSINGYHVRSADSPLMGLESAKTNPPDLVLLDVIMPEMDGFTLCHELKKDAKTESIPVIFISASDDTLSKIKAFEVGGMDYINKPFNTTEVLARISSHLQLSILQKHTQDSLATSQHILHAVMNNSPAIIYIKGLDGRYLMVNQEFEHVVAISNEDVVGKTDYDLFAKQTADVFVRHDYDVIAHGRHKQFEETLKLEGDEQVYLSLKFPLKDANGNSFAMCGISTNITMRKHAEAQLKYLATYDILTKLPNRLLFMELLTRALILSQRENVRHAILFLDLDNFKNVNDSLGHHIGDLLLKEVAVRLTACLRSGDTVARMGGDEFVLLLQRIKQSSEAAEVSEKIIQALAPVFELENKSVFITPSIGVVISPDNGTDAQKLLRNGDTAMYHAKNEGRNTYHFFTEEMNRRVIHRMEIEKELRTALNDEHIVPYYQPKIATKTGKINGVEVLSRWQHKKLGNINPSIFIPVAEETNLAIPLDRYILRMAVQQFSTLINNGLYKGSVSVNLTADHFYRDNLLEFIDNILKEYDFPAKHLDLEITESLMMKHTNEAITLMHEFRDRGIQLSIDDFGTGYSSLSYLQKFPVKTLKIDVSFIHDINKSDINRNLVASIISLAHGQGLDCVAEGVETIEQMKVLQQLECDTLQGFLFSQAVDFDTIKSFLKSKKDFIEYLSNKKIN